ncbi:MAG: PAS domain S-box protein [Phycisphaerae bacterium]|nr:PAS domain S-box protein [Phycisphaerae bacterium]
MSEESKYLRALIETSLDPFVTISPKGKITDLNEATIKATGVSRDELIGTDFSDYFTDPPKARQGYKIAFAKGLIKDYELTIKHIDGSLMHVIYNATVYHNQNGKIIGVFAAARDITHILKGILPICANCKKIRTDIGYWEQVEVFIRDHSNVEFSHSLCPECKTKLYPEF